MNNKYDYQWEYLYENRKPKKKISEFSSYFGTKVIERDKSRKAKKVRIRILTENNQSEYYLVTEKNNWGKKDLKNFRFEKKEKNRIAEIVTELKHKDEYKILEINKTTGEKNYLEDPAGTYFADNGNNIFWDFEDPELYQQQFPMINTFDRPTIILQTELPGLITHFANKNEICGKDIHEKEYYKFITESGIIPYIKELGYNTVQFLPFAQSIDGTNWKYRYLIPFQYAIQKNWGTPEEFKRMIDEFHKYGIAVIGDFVLGHIPYKDFEIFGQSYQSHGIHLWKDKNNEMIYLKDDTPWGTKRINFDNELVRRFFIESCISFMRNYKIDGFRIDNIDGILRYGPTGEGEERPNGRTFLRELNQTIYDYNPQALIHYEAHYFYEDNAKLLVAPLNSSKRALGATCYNSSRITYFFHTKYMIFGAGEISVWRIKQINDEKEWGKSNSTIADFHNHDAAAGLMAGRCTGSYAYDAMMVLSPSNHAHAVGKIKVMEGIIAFFLEGRILDLAQTFLLQAGTFEHDSSIQWFLDFNEINKAVTNYKKEINKILSKYKSLWPINVKNRNFLNIDDNNKVLVIERNDGKKERLVVVINMSDWKLYNYKVGIRTKKNYKCIFNSDEFKYGGFGIINLKEKEFTNTKSHNFELLDREFEIPIIPPYSVLIFKEINKKET